MHDRLARATSAKDQGRQVLRTPAILSVDMSMITSSTIPFLTSLLDLFQRDVIHSFLFRTRVVCPIIDIIHDDTFAYVKSFELHWGAINWEMHFR